MNSTDLTQATEDSMTTEKIISLQSEIAELKARLANYEFHLESGESQLDEAGTGLFTKNFIPAGRVVGEYTGRKSYRLLVPATGRYVMWQEDEQGQPHFLNQDTYILWLVDEEEDDQPWQGDYPELETGIDGAHCTSVMRYANSNDDPNLEMFVTENLHVVAVSLREIEPGEELFWDYHPGRDKDFSVVPDHIETDLERFVTVNEEGWVRLTQEALVIRQQRGGKRNRRKKKKN
ncbi:SET domain-containing protein-lysine N-methyltransferase [Sansalvadorimonas sp. 2012CJ34-2]|uniref:SET domain-containing protein-lysine N-methyltransferase n=1 Tax=Parendozoicomonas callyspongiae TaxID=2942213 RepID=A0ABT0PGS5_9GAMM|nr:SET domain-containing protein-lysine N-methyltransferase [Sansalvadorimonas sp. 2012CJ34-2]MCL6270520.1 SET domain-containing protein-lysine N-methyltransferase [Sansalvadorimonas sp. 2012CJ34-2]